MQFVFVFLTRVRNVMFLSDNNFMNIKNSFCIIFSEDNSTYEYGNTTDVQCAAITLDVNDKDTHVLVMAATSGVSGCNTSDKNNRGRLKRGKQQYFYLIIESISQISLPLFMTTFQHCILIGIKPQM